MDSVRFRNHTRWLLVMVIPVGAFTHAAWQKSNEFFQEVQAPPAEPHERRRRGFTSDAKAAHRHHAA